MQPANEKTIISPAQGLLLLIDHYRAVPEKISRLKKLYLCGAENEVMSLEIKTLLEDEVLERYQVSYDPKIINEDPSRRYFETHLSYETLKNGFGGLSLLDLSAYYNAMSQILPRNILQTVDHVLDGKLRKGDLLNWQQYADCIEKIKTGKIFGNFSAVDREKAELFAKLIFIGVFNAQQSTKDPLPLNIYGTGLYSDVNRGKIMTAGQETTKNQGLGLMKGHMPLPLDDTARLDQAFPYMKPSDQAEFINQGDWVKMNFDKMVHPFSNSISGSILAQLRCLARIRNDGNSSLALSEEKMAQFLKLLTAMMVFNSGGHTLNELVVPLSLPEVRQEFLTTPGFENMNLESMFLKNNLESFDKALNDAISYLKLGMQKKELHTKLIGEPKDRSVALALLEARSNILPETKELFYLLDRISKCRTPYYRLCLMPADDHIKENQIGVEIKQGMLQYKVKSPSGKVKKGMIPIAELEIDLNERSTIEQIDSALPKILTITSRKKHTSSYQDTVLDTFIEEMRKKISLATSEMRLELKEQLQKTLDSVNSREVNFVKKEIKSLRQKATPFSVGMLAKANDIERALSERPLMEREKVISGPANPVQIELATSGWKRSKWNKFLINSSLNIGGASVGALMIGLPTGIGATSIFGVGGLTGSLIGYGMGAALGGALGCGAACVFSGITLLSNTRASTGIRALGGALTSLGAAGIGATIGSFLGSFFPVPILGTVVGAVIGIGVGILVSTVVRAVSGPSESKPKEILSPASEAAENSTSNSLKHTNHLRSANDISSNLHESVSFHPIVLDQSQDIASLDTHKPSSVVSEPNTDSTLRILQKMNHQPTTVDRCIITPSSIHASESSNLADVQQRSSMALATSEDEMPPRPSTMFH